MTAVTRLLAALFRMPRPAVAKRPEYGADDTWALELARMRADLDGQPTET